MATAARSSKNAAPRSAWRKHALPVALACAVAALACAVYLPVLGFGFVNYDDNVYVTDHPRVRQGLTWDNAGWALGAYENGNWHPLTLLSHLLDVALFGLRPAGHHASSAALHAACAAALFLLLLRTTGARWQSATVAALFAVHPLNVESVAWIAERKNPLSTLFWLLALLAWSAYRVRPGWPRYLAVLVLAALAMASKPMAVTLPLTLVLLDLWPLRREPPGQGPLLLRYARELWPFVALSLACGLLTLDAQRAFRALQPLDRFPLGVRLANAPVGYVWYLAKMLWPSNLAVFYPHPMTTLAAGPVAVGTAILVALTVFVARTGRALPYLAMGWLWYAVTLAPVAGIVQVGSQAWADRYAYVPLMGIFIALVWGGSDLASRWRAAGAAAASVAAVSALVALSLATRAQLVPWRDSESLFRHAVRVVPDSSVAQNNLGMALVERNLVAEALDHFRKAVEFAPWDTDARSNLGNALTVLGRPAEAIPEFERARTDAPRDASILFNLAKALEAVGRSGEAEAALREAMRVDPQYARAPLYLGILLQRRRNLDESIDVLQKAVALAPGDPEGHYALGVALAGQGRLAEALARFEETLRLDPSDGRARDAVDKLRGRAGIRP